MKKEIKKIMISDYTQYVEGKSNTGGCYAWYTTYAKEDDGKFSVYHSTSADFVYCEKCGSFGHWADECSILDGYETVSAEEVLAEVLTTIVKIDNGEDYMINFEEEHPQIFEDEYDDEYALE